mgnify:CR=1 FL=1
MVDFFTGRMALRPNWATCCFDRVILLAHGSVYLATADGKALQLTRSEFRLLDTLIRQPGRVFQRSELIDAALGEVLPTLAEAPR